MADAVNRGLVPSRRWRRVLLRLVISTIILLGDANSLLYYYTGMTLGPQPYYWPNTRTLSYANSPPIATRTGWMALACTPFLL